MKRVLSLVLALVLVFGAIVPAFAEETTTKTSGEMLKGYGLIEGTDEGLAEDKPLTRAEMAVILAKLYGKAEEAKTYALPSSFTDVEKDAWYAPWVAYAQAQKWMVGDGKTFRPTENLSVQEINVLMVKVLGYEAEWATANEKAEELKVAVTAADKSLVLRGEIFKAMTTTLDQPKKDGTESLGTVLALTGYVAPVPPTPEKLEVAKVMTDNTKTVVIEFNQEVDKKTVTDSTVKVTGKAGTTTLHADMKTATIVLDAKVAQSTELEVHVKGVKTADAKEVVEYKTKHVANDVTVPVITGIEVVDAKHVKVMASEPIDWSASTFTVLPGAKLDGTGFVGKVVADNVKHEYTIEFNTVKAAGSYKLALEGLKDFSGLAAVKTEWQFDVVKDETAPVATKAESKSTSVIHVTFDEPLATIGSITVNGKATTETFLANSNNKVVVATIDSAADYLTLGATVEVKVAYSGQKDVVGNEVKTSTTLTFKVEDDTTLPTATLAVSTGNKVTITFSKTMDKTLGKIIVMDKDKKELNSYNVSTFSAKWTETDTKLTLVAADLGLSNLNPVTRIIQLKDMKDATVRANLLATVDFTETVLDTKKPVVTATYSKSTGTLTSGTDHTLDDTITFYFSEAMDEDTIKNLSNFKRTTDAGTFATVANVKLKSVAADKKSVTFNYPDVNSFANSDAFSVFAVKDIAGNMADTTTTVVNNTAVLATTQPTVVAKATDKIEVTYPVAISTADPASLLITNTTPNPDEAYTTAISAVVDGAKVTYTLAKALPTAPGAIQVQNGANLDLLVSVFGDKYTGQYALTTITDQMKPVVSKLEDGKYTADGAVAATPNFATITMSEEVTFALTKADFIVKLNDKVLDAVDYNITLVDDTEDKELNVEVFSNTKVTTDGKYKLSIEQIRTTGLADKAGTPNAAAVWSKEITDFDYDYTAPTVTSVEYLDNNTDGTIETIEIVMSGNVDAATVATGDFTVAAGTDAVSQITGITGVAVATNKITLTVTGVANTTVTDDTIAWAANAFTIATLPAPVRAAATMTDKAAPQVATQIAAAATLTTGGTHTLVFTEALDTATAASVKAAVDAAYVTGGTSTATSAWSGATLTVTYTAAANPNDIVFGAIANQTATDAASNSSAALDVQQ